MKPRMKFGIVGLVVLAEGAALAMLVKPMAPVQEGNSADFWRNACGVSADGQTSDGGYSIYQPRDGWFIYYRQSYHGRYLYRVDRAAAAADYPEVLKRVEESSGVQDPDLALHRARRVLSQSASSIRADPGLFLLLMKQETISDLREKLSGSPEYEEWCQNKLAGDLGENEFAERWARSERYWANLVFEFAFFAALSLFAFWPWLRGKRLWVWCIHLGLVPLLLLLPYYLGYCSWTFTSAGGGGGVLYPRAIIWLGGIGFWTSLDIWVLQNLPKILEPLTQSTGPMIVVSGGGLPGPVSAMVVGAGIALLTLATCAAIRKPRKAKHLTESKSHGGTGCTPGDKAG